MDMETKEINMVSVIRTCQDIARGFQYLHEQSMIHGDLKPHNILLQTSSQDARGFIAKVAFLFLKQPSVMCDILLGSECVRSWSGLESNLTCTYVFMEN